MQPKQPCNNAYRRYPIRLTWDRHEYLAKVKSDTIYTKTKEIASKIFGEITMETIKLSIPFAIQYFASLRG